MSATGINICLTTAYIMSVMVVGCWAMPTSGICASPVDLMTHHVGGPATIYLAQQARHLQVRVTAERTVRAGVVVVRLSPVDVDQVKCTAVGDNSFLCYKYLEIRWGLTDGQGSDHSFNGKASELELQHYFRRTDGDRVDTPLAVAVLARPSHHHAQGSMAELIQLLEKEKTSMNLTVGDLLPSNDQGYYQYSGTLPGLCRERTEWLVYDEEMNTPRELLHSLRSGWTQQGTLAHFGTVELTSDLLYSNKSVVPDVERMSRNADEIQESVVSTSTEVKSEMTTATVQPSVQTSSTSSRQTQAPQDNGRTIGANVRTEKLLGALRNVSESGNQTDMGSSSHEKTGARVGEGSVTLGPSNEEVHVGETGVHSVTGAGETGEDAEMAANVYMEAQQDADKTETTSKAGSSPDEGEGAQSVDEVSREDAVPASDARELVNTEGHLDTSASTRTLSDTETTYAISGESTTLPHTEATEIIPNNLLSSVEVTEIIPEAEVLPGAEAHVGALPRSDALPETESSTASPTGTSLTVSEALADPTLPSASPTSGDATTVEATTTTSDLPPTTTEEPSSGTLFSPQDALMMMLVVSLLL